MCLPDGRQLAADDVGDPAGETLVYLHGATDCRLARHPDDSLATGLGVRLVALDRPGYGWSDPLPAGGAFAGLVEFAGDLACLLDHLGVEACRLLAWSAGAPWALAAASTLGPRVAGVTLFGAVPALDALDDQDVAAAAKGRADLAADIASGAVALADLAAALAPPPPIPLELALDHVAESVGGRSLEELGAVPGAIDALASSLVDAVARHGTAGLEADLALQYTRIPDAGAAALLLGAACPVRLVHGEHDAVGPRAGGRWFAERLRRATIEIWADAGHHALFPRWADLLTTT